MITDEGCSPKKEVGGRHKVGGRQTSARTQMYIKRTKWIISYKEVFGRRSPPSAPDYTPVSDSNAESKLGPTCISSVQD